MVGLRKKAGGLYVFTPTITMDNGYWDRGTADAIYQNLDFLRRCHEPYVVLTSGDAVYKLDYNKVLEYHIDKKADITVVCKELPADADTSRFGVLKTDEEGRILDFEEKPIEAQTNTISCGIYVIRRRQLIELIEKCAQEERYDFVRDILIRYKNLKRIYAYRTTDYWNSISSVESYYETNMDFLKADVRKYFFKTYPDVYSKVLDLPPAKYNPGSDVKNSLVASGCIVNGTVENSVLFKKVFVGNNCVIKNSIILNEVYIGDNTYIENCIVLAKIALEQSVENIESADMERVMPFIHKYEYCIAKDIMEIVDPKCRVVCVDINDNDLRADSSFTWLVKQRSMVNKGDVIAKYRRKQGPTQTAYASKNGKLFRFRLCKKKDSSTFSFWGIESYTRIGVISHPSDTEKEIKQWLKEKYGTGVTIESV